MGLFACNTGDCAVGLSVVLHENHDLLSELDAFGRRLQNYYYLLMDMQWREQNDWIHRNEAANQLLIPLDGIRFCGQRNVRPKRCSTAEAVQEHFETVNLPHLERMKEIRPETDVFQNVSICPTL